MAARISCGLKDELHLSSPVGRINGRSDARLLNMTDRSLGKPSNCTVRAIPRPGDAGSAVLVIVRNRAAFPPLSAFPATGCVSAVWNMQRRWKTPGNAERRFYVLKLPSLKRDSEHFENFTSSARHNIAATELRINGGLM